METPSLKQEQAVPQETIEAYMKLEAYLNQGYLLHGSKKQLEAIEPRQAKDDDSKRVAGNLHGIYATENLNVAALRALFAKKDLAKNGWRSSYSGDENNLQVSGENFTFTSGYIYVLPRDSFAEVTDKTGGHDLVSSTSIKPIDVIKIDPAILGLLKGVSINEG